MRGAATRGEWPPCSLWSRVSAASQNLSGCEIGVWDEIYLLQKLERARGWKKAKIVGPMGIKIVGFKLNITEIIW